jgi:signal transduction histidine kinase
MMVSLSIARMGVLLVASLLLWAPAALASVLTLEQADASIRANGVSTQKAVSLPFSWDREHKGQQGEARFVMHFDLPQAPKDAWGLYLERVGSAYEVWLNGNLLERRGRLDVYNGDDFGQLPHYVNVPYGDLFARNRLEIRIRADVGRRGGLSSVVIGPAEEVYAMYRSAHHWNVTAAFVVLGFICMVGLGSLALWATQHVVTLSGGFRRDRVYLYAGLAELFWTLRLSNSQFESPPMAWPWWGMVPVWGMAAWSGLIAFFCMELAGWQRTPRTLAFRWALVVMMVSGPLAAWAALGGGAPIALTLWYAFQGLLFMGFGLWFLRQSFRTPSRAQQVVALVVLVNVGFGLRDLYVYRVVQAYPVNSWIYFSSALFGLSLGYVVITRFREVSMQARELMNTLSTRVAQRERELNSSYQRLELLAREQERTAERTRILRDMHDGVGSHISAAIRQLQSGRARDEDVLLTLRGSLDQLKLTIDAMHLPHGDITALLANLRYRLAPRFSASDVELEWGVDLIDPIHRLDGLAMRHLQFMVFEALSNVLQHAQANWLRIEAAMSPAGALLRIVDNGRGFDVSAPPRKGLASLRERAAAIGARLRLDSAPGRTVVEILIPID